MACSLPSRREARASAAPAARGHQAIQCRVHRRRDLRVAGVRALHWGRVSGRWWLAPAPYSCGMSREHLFGAFGMFWERDSVDWAPGVGGRAWQLLGCKGERRPGPRLCDVRSARGFYLLFDDHGAHDVGSLADKTFSGRAARLDARVAG